MHNKILISLVLLSSLVACGQKGPLYQVKPDTPVESSVNNETVAED